MFDWLRELFGLGDDDRQKFVNTIDALNAELAGGEPTQLRKMLGRLKLRSRALVFADPQSVPGLVVGNIAADEVHIYASLWQYPSGNETVIALRLVLDSSAKPDNWRNLGEIGIDSAKLIIADELDIKDHWAETGPQRIGMISTVSDDAALRLLTARFRLRTVRENPFLARVVEPISTDLQRDIEAFLAGPPMNAPFPFIHFRVETNSSFERANAMDKSWGFIPVGIDAAPLMFVCGTGRGDGCYALRGEFAGEQPCVLTVDFIRDE